MRKIMMITGCSICLFCGSVGAFKVDINKVPPECRSSIGSMEDYNACMKSLKKPNPEPVPPPVDKQDSNPEAESK